MERKRITDYKVDYTKLSNAIRNSTVQGKGIDFTFDLEHLQNSVNDSSLIVVPNYVFSKRVGPEDIVFLGEFFKKSKLAWLDRCKFFSSLIFVRTDVPGALDDEFYHLIDLIKLNQFENPDIDKPEAIARVLSKYPCYTAVIVSYKNADIKRNGTISFEVVCKANQITIEVDNAKYSTPDNFTNN